MSCGSLRMALVMGALALVSVAGISIAQTRVQPDTPRVRMLATGGTIGTRGATRLTAEEILQLVPGLSGRSRLTKSRR